MMKEKLLKLVYSKAVMITIMVIALLTPLFNYAFRFGYVYIDNALFKGFSLSLFVFMVLNAVAVFTLFTIKIKEESVANKKLYKVFYFLSLILTIIFAIVILVNMIVSGSESIRAAGYMIKDIFPVWLSLVAILFFAFLFPAIKSVSQKKVLSALTAICLVITFVFSIFSVTPYKFLSSPVVFDNASGYSVVFSTNDLGTAYIEYSFDGKDYRVFDENNGRKNASSHIHTIKVPYEHLNNNSYKVGSTRIIDELAYGGRSGKTIESSPISFKGTFSDNINVLTISDWHTYSDLAKDAIKKAGNYDALIMLGDACAGIQYEEEIIRNILKLGSELTKGTMPIIFTRGNHETRGKMASELSDFLGIDNFYYKTTLGKYDIIVLDSGEDKNDNHSEYGGMVNYEQFRKEMVDWLLTLENSDNTKTIALSHSDEICIEEDLAAGAKEKLSALDVSLLVSGHTHKSEYKKGEDFPTLINGGISENKKSYIASLISLSNDGISMASYDNNGQKIIEEKTSWK